MTNRMARNFLRMNRAEYDSLMIGKQNCNSFSSRFASPYTYRRESTLNGEGLIGGIPNLTITGKLREKQNIIFSGVPNLHELPEDDRKIASNGVVVTKKDLEDYAEEEKRKKEKMKQYKKNIPSPDKIRERLRLIVKFHKKEVEESMPSAYPILGPAGEDFLNEEKEDRDGNDKNLQLQKNSDCIPISYSQKTKKTQQQQKKIGKSSGRQKNRSSSSSASSVAVKSLSAALSSKQPPKKRGKK